MKHGLIVSCQALPDEPLHSSYIMARMAVAAKEGGACAIRSNSGADVRSIREATGLPVIGLVKRDYPDSEIYITATRREVDELIEAGADMIALDATLRPRPNGEKLSDLIAYVKSRGALVMADISTLDEAVEAAMLGADCVSTTLSGYTPYSPKLEGPDLGLVRDAVRELSPRGVPVIAEGRIWDPADAARALEAGAYAVVVGSAISRPQLITRRYAEAVKNASVKLV
ncbi:N-acetylmannosamine-6-phosphate 2-epimerase [Paenibacillus thermoaerophilus]|nr:N-acetylmannosamine-6-phosphate 2-epimerase [Paenibacillus thermoaerophilus]